MNPSTTAATSAATFLDSALVSIFHDSTHTTPVDTVSLATVLQRIQQGVYRQHVEKLRQMLTTQGKDAYDKAKKASLGFTPAGIFSKRANAKLTQPSGLLNFDFDHLPNVADAKTLLIDDPWVVYAFISPGGDGLKVAVWADGIVDDTTYKWAWGIVLAYFQKTYPDLAVSNDKACKDIARLCYVSHDPDLHVNPDALLYAVPRFQPPAAKPKPKPAGQRTSSPLPTARQQIYAQQAIDTAIRMIDSSVLGNRHHARLKASRLLGGYVAGGILTYGETQAALQEVVERNTDDLPRAMRTIVDGLRYGQDNPITFEELEAERLDWLQVHQFTMTVTQNGSTPAATNHAASPTSSNGQAAPSTQTWGAHQINWKNELNVTRGGEVKETFNNMSLALENLAPWHTESWYDVVRDRGMVDNNPVEETQIWAAARAIEQQTAMPIRNLKLISSAVRAHCGQKRRDLLQEWLSSLPPWDGVERLTEWLCDHAGAAKTAYVMDVSRLLLVSMVARARKPGCQCRAVIILEGRENIGKSKLVETLAGPGWYRDVSGSLEGKEAHMILKGTWVVELSELSSLGRTEESRLKSFITMANDEYVPKYANDPIKRERRTVLIGTMNPEGDRTYLRSQTGNTRFYPVEVTDINLDDIQLIREQLFAEALNYYERHPIDWWQLSAEGERQASEERERRRQRGVYEDSLAAWLATQGHTLVWWEMLADEYLHLAKDKWVDRRAQIETAKSLYALGWQKQPRRRVSYQGQSLLVYPWEQTS